MEVLSILAAVALGSVTTGGVAAVLLRLFEKRVSQRIELLHEREKVPLEIMRTLARKALDASEVLPITMGRAMKLSREVASQWPSVGDGLATALEKSIDEFETELYRYYGVVRPDVYDKLHRYKSTARDFLGRLRQATTETDGATGSQETRLLLEQLESERQEALTAFRNWVASLHPFRQYYEDAFTQ